METPTPTRIRVLVRAWGATEKDARKALDAVTYYPERNRWEIVDTEVTTGATCTITSDPAAHAQRRGYGWAYAVYKLPETAPADA